jgi:hypothetical protein
VDKAVRDGRWSYFEETAAGEYSPLTSPSGGADGVLPYLTRKGVSQGTPAARRGLSPGTQNVLTLTEGARVRAGLSLGRDVVPCVTTLRHLPDSVRELTDAALRDHYRLRGKKCWLVRTDTEPSPALEAYLSSVPAEDYQTKTCLARDEWWRFAMPAVPDVLVAMSFKTQFPKVARNSARVRAVGGVYGVYGLSPDQIAMVTAWPTELDIRDRIVAHAHGLRKVEIGQLNSLLLETFGGPEAADA